MGLDVTAYETVTLLKACTVKEANELKERPDDGDAPVVLLYSSFKERTDGMVEGFYEYSGGVHVTFEGGYGYYNQWRAALARLVGKFDRDVWSNPVPGPFVELIHFSDCEGFIGPQTCAKLAADFREYAGRTDSVVSQTAFARHYADFRKAFELASEGGAVKFH